MEDKVFKREQVRRNLQEVLNDLDKAIAFEGSEDDQEGKDLSWVLKLFPYSLEMKELVETFMKVKDKKVN